MTRSKSKRQTGCPIAFALDTFGDKWSLIIIRDMLMRGKETYGEFLAADEKIATNILADRLQHLQDEGLIEKSRDPQNRRRFLYRLTPKGLDLAPIVLEMVRWSAAYDPNTKASQAVVTRIQSDREGLLKDIIQKSQRSQDEGR
ncbi:MAG: helix-turn-helix domain-containing protein [Robiginitomaculum sp.]|nr:helix-turn-helix domain-containing protein [Robiginitomaculum sp.]MDQ7078172.1 helix-turn-helix domain-containing protein [Robiginitomaculum sp.]